MRTVGLKHKPAAESTAKAKKAQKPQKAGGRRTAKAEKSPERGNGADEECSDI